MIGRLKKESIRNCVVLQKFFNPMGEQNNNLFDGKSKKNWSERIDGSGQEAIWVHGEGELSVTRVIFLSV